MKDDPTILRVREARQRISAGQAHDPERLVRYYLELQKEHQHRLLKVQEEPVSERAES